MRLTNQMRDDILQGMIAELFKPREEALIKRERELGRRLREAILGDQEAAWEAVPKRWRNATDTVAPILPGVDFMWMRLPKGLDVPSADDRVEVKGRLARDIERWAQNRAAYREELREFRSQARGILQSVTTDNKLAKVWPEAKPFIPAAEVPSQALVSVDHVNRLMDRARQKAKQGVVR